MSPFGGSIRLKSHALARALVRTVCVLTLPLAAGAGLLSSAPAQAAAANGSLGFVSDPGDFIGGGVSASYSTTAGDQLTATALTDANGVDQGVEVSVTALSGDFWTLDMEAPAGNALAAGTYNGAVRFPFNNALQPGLSFTGDFRGCNTVTGTFTVTDALFGPHGYIQQLDATFVQHCEGGSAALTGEVHILNPPPPPVLAPAVGIAADGIANTVDGQAMVHGTVTCNEPVTLTVSGTVTEVIKKSMILTGDFATSVACAPGATVPWSANAVPTVAVPFLKGLVEVNAQAAGLDPNYGVNVSVSQSAVVKLRSGK